MNVNTAIGAKVKQRRTENKMTLKQLGEQTGLSVGFLSQFERGLSSIALDSLEKISRVLEVPLSDLFEEHGKTLNFVCQIITNENVYLADKQRSSDWTAKLCKMLDLDGVIVSQEGFGNPDTDLIMNCKKIEAEGVKTVIITDEYAGRDGKSQSLADADAAADAVVTGGNANEVIILPKLDKVIGTLDYVTKIAGASEETLREDGSLEVELQVITGATNETGFNKLSAR